MARSLAISRWGRSRLARRMIWMRSLALGLVSWRKACSRDWDSASGSRMRITFGQSSLSFLLSLYAPDTFTGYVYETLVGDARSIEVEAVEPADVGNFSQSMVSDFRVTEHQIG